jgi:hypothetical protein
MNTSLTDVANALATILGTIPDVDATSIDSYLPVPDSQKICLMVVPFSMTGVMEYGGMGRQSLVHSHQMVCEFWVKVNMGNQAAAMTRGRDICLQAMALLSQNHTLNGTVQTIGSTQLAQQNTIGRYDVLPRYEERNTIPFIIARLFVPIEIRATVDWS